MWLGDNPMHLGVSPDLRTRPIGIDVGERARSKDLVDRYTVAIGETLAAKKSEGGIHLARHQQEHKRSSKTAAADCPLFKVHVIPAPRAHANIQGDQGHKSNHEKRPAHGRISLSTAAGWLHPGCISSSGRSMDDSR